MTDQFEPRILGFLCNWCSYAGADLAGVSRISYPTNIRIIRTMCSGRVDPLHVLESFRQGVDGVLVTGCHIGDCHYITGNHACEKRVIFLKETLDQVGIDARRLRLEWISASEGGKFARIVKEFIEEIRSLGPSRLRKELVEEAEQ
jgi:F420-non-reducing hydrogenase iron-sulfur subunit